MNWTDDAINDRLKLALSIGDIGRADILRELQTTRAALEQKTLDHAVALAKQADYLLRAERAEAALERARALVWQPIETAPKDKRILLWGRYWSDDQGWFTEPLIGMWVDIQYRWVCVWSEWFGVRPTHWMPLPDTSELAAALGPAPDGAR